jgi:acetyl esterase/lipase
VCLWVPGGGFVGRSTASDSLTLATWAASARPDTDPLLFAFPHYSLSPGAVFPAALNELGRVYTALRAAGAARVVVGGNSAGGNLAAALTLHRARSRVPPPDAVVLAYPALNLNPAPSASRALHLHDPVVPVALLVQLAQADFGSGPGGYAAGAGNPLLHPALAADADLARFPPTALLCGGLDPLLDDSVDLHTRLARVGVPCELTVFRGLPHGWLNFGGVPGAGDAIDGLRRALFAALRGEGGGGGGWGGGAQQ